MKRCRLTSLRRCTCTTQILSNGQLNILHITVWLSSTKTSRAALVRNWHLDSTPPPLIRHDVITWQLLQKFIGVYRDSKVRCTDCSHALRTRCSFKPARNNGVYEQPRKGQGPPPVLALCRHTIISASTVISNKSHMNLQNACSTSTDHLKYEFLHWSTAAARILVHTKALHVHVALLTLDHMSTHIRVRVRVHALVASVKLLAA